ARPNMKHIKMTENVRSSPRVNSAVGGPNSNMFLASFSGRSRSNWFSPPMKSPPALWVVFIGLFQPPVQPRIRHLPRLRREVVLAVRVVRRQLVFRPEQRVDRPRRRDAVLDAAYFEVGVAGRGAGQERPRREGGHHFG